MKYDKRRRNLGNKAAIKSQRQQKQEDDFPMLRYIEEEIAKRESAQGPREDIREPAMTRTEEISLLDESLRDAFRK